MRNTIITLIAFAVFASCGGGNGTNGSATADSTAAIGDAAKRIRSLEDSLSAKSVFDMPDERKLYGMYLAFSKAHPLDSLAPEYLFRAAGAIKNLGDPQAGVDLYDRIIKNYPQWRKIPDAYYLKAFTLDDALQLKGAAKQAYEEVISRFPDHPFAKEAKLMIDYLQYTPEELIEHLKKMNGGTVDSATAGR